VIERRTEAGAFLAIATPSTGDLAAYTDASLDERTTYTYRIKAGNSLGDSGYSNEAAATTVLATPANAAAVAASSNLVNVSWTDLSSFETGYRVERKTGSGGAYSAIATLPADTIRYADNSVTPGTFFTYRIQALDTVSSTQSAYSNEASVSTPGLPVEGGDGGGCQSISRPGSDRPIATSLFSVGILLFPACALGLRRFFRRQVRTVPIRHPLC